MTKNAPRVPKKELPIARQVGPRIKQAREMGGFDTQAKLNAILTTTHGWSPSRLGNYEAGYSIPGPDDVDIIAKETGTSACWIMFGAGPIGSREREIQAIRHQNLVHTVESLKADQAGYRALLDTANTSPAKVELFVSDPGKAIGDRIARQMEKVLGKRKGWFDEQHVEHDPLCARFPDELRELMSIYSEQDERGRKLLLQVARVTNQS
jgi:hypothetical protein